MKRILFALFAALLGACTQIDTGNVGVEKSLGKVNATELPPGIYWTLMKTVAEVTTKEVAFQVNDLRPKSKDNLTMADVDVDVYFKVTPGQVADLFVKYQGDMMRHDQLVKGGTDDLVVGFNRVFREAREAVYQVISQYEATTMHTQRAEIAEGIRKALQGGLDTSDPGAFAVTTINVRSLTTDPAIEQAIRAKAEMDQRIGQRAKEVELAKQEAERLRVEAEGQARANKILADSITQPLIAMKNAEALMEFAKKGSSTVMIPSNVTPLVQVK